MRRKRNNGDGFMGFLILMALSIVVSVIKFMIEHPVLFAIPAVPLAIFLIYLILKRFMSWEKANMIVYIISVVLVFGVCSVLFIGTIDRLCLKKLILIIVSLSIIISSIIFRKRFICFLEERNIHIIKSLTIKKYKDKIFTPDNIPSTKDFPGIYLILNDTKNILYVGHTNDSNSLAEAKNQFLFMNANNCIYEDLKYGKNKFLICFLPFKNNRYDKNCLKAKRIISEEEIEYVCPVYNSDIHIFKDVVKMPVREKMKNGEIEKVLYNIDKHYIGLTNLNNYFEDLNSKRVCKVESISYCAKSKREFDGFDYKKYIHDIIYSDLTKYKKIVDAEEEFMFKWPEYLSKFYALPKPLSYHELNMNNISMAKYKSMLPQKIEPSDNSFKIILHVYYDTAARKNHYKKYFILDVDEISNFVNGRVALDKKKHYTVNNKNKKDIDFELIVDKWFSFETIEYYRHKYNDFDGIYVLHNNDKNKYYVGQSVNVLHRIHSHFTNGGCKDAYSDFLKGDKFTIRLMPLKISDFDNLDDYERAMIARYNSYYRGYNKTRGNNNYYKSFYA